MKKAIAAIVLALMCTFFSAAFDRELIETRQDRSELGGLALGYPFTYVHQKSSLREPPLPAYFGLEPQRVERVDAGMLGLNFLFYLGVVLGAFYSFQLMRSLYLRVKRGRSVY
ncbi:hypothetical protein [Halobacillus yeomjeoni]|uniref:Uncharacterized protein n=1 Tax=Halobacillus yeomjeoni TaxID=311194 RepID=A0A931HYB2_9BACI|nr:hypothetical protein [Halobacillus yeomjeoni]MBH0231476.1 hypothetical protein [Halobacillus yeomjeoni]